MKRLLYFALLIYLMSGVKISATPYGGSIAGGGQRQRAFVSGYRYIPDNTGPVILHRPRANRRFFDGRVPGNIGPSGRIYESRWRYSEANQNSSSVHSRK